MSLRLFWPALLPLLAFLAMLRAWRARGRDPKRYATTVWYEAPDGLRPGPLGALIDHHSDMREVTATLVDLAVRGFFRIQEAPPGSGGTYVFHLAADRIAEWDTLAEYEQQLLRCVFKGGRNQVVRMEDMKQHFHRYYEDMRNAIWEELVAKGYYARRPEHVQRLYVALGAAVAGLSYLAIQVVNRELLRIEVAEAPLAGFLAGAVIAVWGWFMPARTARGSRLLSQALGFREFLDRVESDRFRRLIKGPRDFEKFLPYAMALGLEERWARAFRGIYSVEERKAWYRGSVDFRFALLHADLSSLLLDAALTERRANLHVPGLSFELELYRGSRLRG